MSKKKKDEGIRSALDIAMERFGGTGDGPARLTGEQKEELAGVERELQAKIAEIEILSGRKAEEAAARGDTDEEAAIRAGMQDEIARLRRKADGKKDAIRRKKG